MARPVTASRVSPPAYDITKDSTVLYNFDTVADWNPGALTLTADTTYVKEGTQSIKVTGMPSAGSKMEMTDLVTTIGTSWDFSGDGVIRIRVWCENLISNSYILVRLSAATAVAGNNIYISRTRNDLQEGWNELVMFPRLNDSAHDSGGFNWTPVGATTDFSNPMQAIGIVVTGDPNSTVMIFDSIEYEPRNRPKVMIGFDAIDTDITTTVEPYMTAAGMKGYVAVEGDATTSYFSNSTAIARMQTVYDAGWDVIGHSVDHRKYGNILNTSITESPSGTYTVVVSEVHQFVDGETIAIEGAIPTALNGTYTMSLIDTTSYSFTTTGGIGNATTVGFSALGDATTIYNELAPNFQAIRDNGFDRSAAQFAYPGNSVNTRVVGVLEGLGIKTARGLLSPYISVSSHGWLNPLWYGSLPLRDTTTLQQAKDRIDACIEYGVSINLFSHGVATVATNLVWATADFQALIDYIQLKVQQGFLDVVTPSEFSDQMGL